MPVRFPGSGHVSGNSSGVRTFNTAPQSSYYQPITDPQHPSCFGNYNVANVECITCPVKRECILEQDVVKAEKIAEENRKRKVIQEEQEYRAESAGTTVRVSKKRKTQLATSNDMNRMLLHAFISGLVAFLSDLGLQLIKDVQYRLER